MTLETIGLLVAFATKYTIPAALQIIALFEKKEATVDEVRGAFANAHKAYESYENLPEGSTIPPLPPA